MRDLRFSQRYWWRFKSSGILHCGKVLGLLFPEDGSSTLLRHVDSYLPVDAA